MFEQRLQFRRKRHAGIVKKIQQGLDAEMIPRQKQRPLLLIPQTEGKDAVEPLDARRPPTGVAIEDDFGIGMRAEGAALCFEQMPEFSIVINFAVERDEITPGHVAHRLRAFGQINNRQTPMPERHALSEKNSFSVRPAMRHEIARLFHPCFRERRRRECYFSGNSTHNNLK